MDNKEIIQEKFTYTVDVQIKGSDKTVAFQLIVSFDSSKTKQ